MWRKDQATEDRLTRLGIKFEFRTAIPISKLKENKENPRLNEVIHAPTLAKIVYEMQHGVNFAAPVLTPQLKTLGGTHRIAGAKEAEWATVDAYIVTEGTAEAVELFTRLDNTEHGRNLNDEQVITAAVGMNKRHGTPLKELAEKFFGVGPSGNSAYDRMCSRRGEWK